MPRLRGPNATIAWLRSKDDPDQIAGAAFLVGTGADLALTCAHVIREHLGLATPTPREVPQAEVTLRFESIGREVAAHVLAEGWWPDSAAGEFADLAVLRLAEPLAELDCAGLALAQPRPREKCYVYGAVGGYQGFGQTVYAQLAVHAHPPTGWHQLNARPGEERGYFVKRGFSGAAVFDEMGNTIWGMVVAVETEPGTLVAFAIPSEDLRAVTKKAVEAARQQGEHVSAPKERPADSVDERGRDAVSELIARLRESLAQEPGLKAEVLRELGAPAR